MNKVFMLSRAGCFLPFLIVFNLLFGWMFFKPLHWLLIEAGLVLLFMFTSAIMIKGMFSVHQPAAKRKNVIDVESEVVEEHKQLDKD